MATVKSGSLLKRLSDLKKWLTVPDAARHLTIVFGEDVSEADVLRLALDGHLKISVNFVNHATAIRGKVIPIDEATYRELSPWALSAITIPGHQGEPVNVMEGLNLDGKRVLELEDELVTLDGVFDLAMIGNERIDIEHKYQMLTGGPSVDLSNLEGAFVMSDAETMFQLQDRMKINKEWPKPLAAPQKSENDDGKTVLEIESVTHTSPKEANVGSLWEVRDRRLKARDDEFYYPAAGLPDNSAVVVRTEALTEFERSLSAPTEVRDDPITPTERNTLLIIIAALCDYSDIKHADRNTAKQISGFTAEIGAPVTDETVRTALNKIPDALERRKR
ncbi:MAG: hypothetical protein H7293_12940 [Candidatus Saccharibacteria bacterium]|nr:hypothetical protein [Rhodoferax sp.]